MAHGTRLPTSGAPPGRCPTPLVCRGTFPSRLTAIRQCASSTSVAGRGIHVGIDLSVHPVLQIQVYGLISADGLVGSIPTDVQFSLSGASGGTTFSVSGGGSPAASPVSAAPTITGLGAGCYFLSHTVSYH